MVQPHERGVGTWQSEWQTITDILQLAGGSIARIRETLDGLAVDSDRMLSNLQQTGDLLLGERIVFYLAPHIGRAPARRWVEQAGQRALKLGQSLGDQLTSDPELAEHLSPNEVAQLLDPSCYLGATETFIERALDAYRDQLG
jgi:3-carboxy-cis,cis-muconate cycloisomerase